MPSLSPFHPEVPFAPKKIPFFYGWVILAAGTLGIVMSIPGQTAGVSVFTDPLIEAMRLTRLEVATSYLAGTFVSGLTLPFGGRLLDRFGARKTVLAAAFGLAGTLAMLSQIDHVASAFADGAIVAGVTLALGFAALRFSGQGMLTMVCRTMIGKWFHRRRGLTSAISGVFAASAFAAAPSILNAWTGVSGWRGAWQQMAILVALVMGGVGWLFFRDAPEECGLQLDGDPEAPPDVGEQSTRKLAIRTRSFWALSSALAIHGMVVTGITFHIVDLGSKAGLDREEALAIFIPIWIFSTASGAIVGWAADRVQIRTLVLLMLIGELIAYSAATQLSTTPGLVFTIIGLGATGGFFGPLSLVGLPRLFGRRHLGAIAGFQTGLMVVGSALGPAAFALSERRFDSYAPVLFLSLSFPAAALLLAALSHHENDVAPLGRTRSATDEK